MNRSNYPWGGLLALTALYAARGLRGARAEAEDALSILEEPGRIFAESGPAAQGVAAVGRLRLMAIAGEMSVEAQEQAKNLRDAMLGFGRELGAFSSLCAFVDIAGLIGDAELAAPCVPALRFAQGEGVIFAGGGEFLVTRLLGVAAALAGDRDEAIAQLNLAIEQASAAGARPDTARCHLDLADVYISRAAAGDTALAKHQLGLAVPVLQELEMVPILARAEAVASALGETLPPPAREVAAESGSLGSHEIELLKRVARGRSDDEICDELLVRQESLATRMRALFDKLGVSGRTGATAYAFSYGVASPAGWTPASARTTDAPRLHRGRSEGAPQIIFVSDIVGSTQMIGDLGDVEAQRLTRIHNRLVRSCTRAHGGDVIQPTGDGFIITFASAALGVRCAIAVQRGFARHNASQPATPIHVRVGLHSGEPLADEGRLFGMAMNASARICSAAAGDEILVSDALRALCDGSELEFEGVGEFALKGIEERMPLNRVLFSLHHSEIQAVR